MDYSAVNTVNDTTNQNDLSNQIDFKMVTFTLAGKDYGIDIMKIKEISKAGQFTFVPNSAAYVRGVFNLRGEIISIIDLRIMFNLPAAKKQDGELENILILRFEEHTIGVIVDTIDKVIGIAKNGIQPPHPIFGDINIKFISGVVDYDKSLYIILDAERIFHTEEQEDENESVGNTDQDTKSELVEQNKEMGSVSLSNIDNTEFSFIPETLATFKNFYVTSVNQTWVQNRFDAWKATRSEKGVDLQLRDPSEAEEFLSTFNSPFTGQLWSEEYMNQLSPLLNDISSSNINVWNPGCGKGYETYSIAVMLKEKFPNSVIRIRSNDKDLLSISSAPNLNINKDLADDVFHKYLVESKNGVQFNTEIKDMVMFEYHDIMHSNTYTGLDLILSRDMISFLKNDQQKKFLSDINEKIKPGGILVLGQNEIMESAGWESIVNGSLAAYKVISS